MEVFRKGRKVLVINFHGDLFSDAVRRLLSLLPGPFFSFLNQIIYLDVQMVDIADYYEPNHFKGIYSYECYELSSGGTNIYRAQVVQGSSDSFNDGNVGEELCPEQPSTMKSCSMFW